MTLLDMSSKTYSSRDDQPYEQIYEEVMDHMKRSGAFDEIRVKLVEPLSSDPEFKAITEKFIQELNMFLHHIDLSQSRNAVRAKISQRFSVNNSSGYSGARRDLEALIRRIMKERQSYIEEEYYKHARGFLRKFLPEPSPPPKEDTPEPEPKPQPDLDHEPITQDSIEDMEIETNPVKVKQEKEVKITNDESLPTQEKKSMALMEEEDMDIESSPSSVADEIERPQYSPILETGPPSLDDIPIPPDNGDDDDRLTFDSVSTIDTVDLDEFDPEVELADDEATLLRLPKNKQINVKELQENISEFETRYVSLIKQEPDEATYEQSESTTGPLEFTASESDGGTSETAATEKRVARTRKSNPRYNNEDFKLYKS